MAQARPNSISPLGMPFLYKHALHTVVYKDLFKALKECKRLSDCSGATYFQQLPMYTAALPYHWVRYPEDMTRFLEREITEPDIKRQFEKEGLINWSTSLPTLYPLVTTGDGNCLLHAAAIYMWGIEDPELFLRTSLWESMVNGSFSDDSKQRWQAERSSVDQAAMSFEFKYNTKEWNEEYDMLKTMAAPIVDESEYDLPYKSLEEFHIYALANMLRRPIMIISNDKIRNPEGASLQPQSVSGLYLPLDWDPSLCCKFPIVLGFSHSHFFPLVHTAPEDEKDEIDLMVPLIIHNELAKVHFTLPGEDPPALLTDYLHVDNFIHCPKNRETAVSLNGAKLSCANMGSNYSVWVPYFDLAEIILGNYNEVDRIPRRVDSSEKLPPDIVNRREALLNKLGMEDHSQSQPRQSPPYRRQGAPPQQMQGRGKVNVNSYSALPKKMEYKAMNSRIELLEQQLREDRIPRRVDSSEKLPPRIFNCRREALLNKLRMGDRSHSQPGQSPLERRQDAPPQQIQGRGEANINRYSALPKKMEYRAMENTTEHLEQQLRVDRIPRRVDSFEKLPPDIVNRREALLNKLGMEDRSHSQPGQSPPYRRQGAPPQQIQGRGKVNVNSYSALPKKMEYRAMENTTEHLEQQLREDRIPRRVDSSEKLPPHIFNCRREALLNKLRMEDRSHSQPGQSPLERRLDAPPQQIQGRGEANINSYPALPKKMEFKAMENTTEHLEPQLRDLESQEIEKLREKNLCKICLDNDIEMLFLPCKHLVTCADCATRIDTCPICRTEIDDKIYVYMP
ncbi:uncharacterized protein [Apostichopus japonicus]|uniref:uncharacterized protein isoform X2 n=1 Tax=Stichopus japonicus TaxID=307972 RepID=UPI003AB335C4